MEGSDEDYQPLPEEESEDASDEGGEAAGDDVQAAAFELGDLDEEDYLRGAMTAEEDEEEEEGGRDIFEEGQDPLSMLAGMEQQGAAGGQPFELLAAANRRRRGRRAAAGEQTDEDDAMDEDAPGGRQALFGASVDDIWNDPLADKLGLAPSDKSRKKRRNKERWKKRAAKRGVKSRDLPEEVAVKLGEANLLYASQKHEEAIALLMEVIRLAPNLPDPYHTLGLLHEAVGNSKKALDFYMIAAHITPKDIPLWKRLAEMSSEHGLVRQAIYCLTQVLKRDKEDLDARYDRALLYAELDDDKKAIEGLEHIQSVRPEHPEVPKALARLHHRAGQPAKAAGVIETFLRDYPAHTDLTHINILAELYGEAGRWDAVLQLVQRVEREFCTPPEGEGEEEEGGLPVDLQVKAGVALAQLGEPDRAAELLSCLLQEPVEAFADLYAEAGTVLLGAGRPQAALTFYRALAEHPQVSTAEVWGRMAVCHRAMGDEEGALQVYQTLAEQLTPGDPTYVDAMVAIAELHRELGQQEDADRVMTELEGLLRSHEALPEEQGAAVEALLRRASILLACGKHDAYLDLALPVLGGTLRALENESEQGVQDPILRRRLRFIGNQRHRRRRLQAAVEESGADRGGLIRGHKRQDRRKKHIKELDEKVYEILQQTDSEGEDEMAGGLVMRELLREEGPFLLLVQSGQVLLQEERYVEARELMQAALDVCGKRWSDRWKRDVLRLVQFEAAFALRDFTAALQHLRSVCARWPHSPVVWNAYARYLTETGSIRQGVKHLQPLRTKHPASLPLMLMVGHCHLLNTQYAEALGEYFHAWRVKPDEPLVLLCIAAALINQATTRRVPDRHRAVLQAFAFLNEYARHRRNPQEAAYNTARAAHHLNLLHIAVPYYERVLAAAPPAAFPGGLGRHGAAGSAAGAAAGGERAGEGGGGDGAVGERPASAGSSGQTGQGRRQEELARYDLKREAAFNLSLIYRSSGSDDLAREVLRAHCTL